MSLIEYIRHHVRVLYKPSSIFSDIYKNRTWMGAESASGRGSDTDQTLTLVSKLPKVISDLNIRSILDIPCGDLNWIVKVIDEANIDYIGADIVEDLIDHNKNKFKRNKMRFMNIDLRSDDLPKSDLVMSRDCLVHMSFEDAKSSIRNILKSNCKYISATTFTSRKNNKDIPTGRWRPLNMQIAPFNFPEPFVLINENCTEGGGMYSDKCLGFWKVEELNL